MLGAASAWAPPDPRDCGKGISCYGCYKPSWDEAISCNASNFTNLTCVKDPKGRLGPTLETSTPAECCAKCSSTEGCTAWTHFDGPKCNLFSRSLIEKVISGNCTSGGVPVPAPPPAPGANCKDCPNIILFLTDDQDLLIGGWNKLDSNFDDPMASTKRVFVETGMTATSWSIHTSICAPSRSELMSGRYFHNIKNPAKTPPNTLCGSGAVGHIDLKEKVYPNVFARYLREQKGYATGLFGKCMNGFCHNPPEMNGAFDRWFEGTNFYGGTWWDDGKDWKNSTYGGGYGTSIIGNKTIDWITSLSNEKEEDQRPFFVYFAPHAPHSPATPADWYADSCSNTRSPRTPAYNYSTPEFHNLVSRQPPFNDQDEQTIDELAVKRCQSLLSVSDSYTQIYAFLEAMPSSSRYRADNTYFMITSDHGYNLGQHRLPSNKFLVYDHTTRIPMVFKGPGIAPKSTLDFMGTQVDLAPTILGLAGIDKPKDMDGQSIVSLLVNGAASDTIPGSVQRHLASTSAPPQRTSAFYEYYNQGPWEIGNRHPLDDWSNTYIGIWFRNESVSWKYAEYDPYGKQSNFTSVYFTEFFDLSADPWELKNLANETGHEQQLDFLHGELRKWYECKGDSCL